MLDELRARLAGVPGATTPEKRGDGLWLDAPELDVLALARVMLAAGFRLSTLTGTALADGESAVIYHYCCGAQALNARTRTRGNALPSITAIVPAANWAEREIHDLYAVNFTGHPDLARLIRPEQCGPGMFRTSS